MSYLYESLYTQSLNRYPGMINQQKISQAVEAICATGCESVNATILTLESGNIDTSFSDFEPDEIHALISELKAIMSVYDHKD